MTPSLRKLGIIGFRCGMGLTEKACIFGGAPCAVSVVRPVRRVGIFFLEAISPWWSRSQNHRDISFPNIPGDPVRRVRNESVPFCRDGFGLESIFSVPKFKTRSGSKIQKVGKRTVPQKRPQKSRPQIQKGLLNQKASGKKLSVVQGFPAGKALQKKLSDVQAFPYSVLNKGYLLNQKASGEKLSTLRTGLSTLNVNCKFLFTFTLALREIPSLS